MEGSKGLFAIDSKTGNITLLKGLNREIVDQYQVTVKATDNGVPVKLSSEAKVSQLNDNSDESILRSIIKELWKSKHTLEYEK